MLHIEIDQSRCTGCGTCADFCPVSVFEMQPFNGTGYKRPAPIRIEACWGCDTCVGQCPSNALRVTQPHQESQPATSPHKTSEDSRYDPQQRWQCFEWASILERALLLRWPPVAINLIPATEALPDVPKPRTKLRFCQSLMAARRGKSLLMPADCHACPDGTSILGITEIPPKLASGELYIRFGKLASLEAARQMVAERPKLAERSIQATLVTPLSKAPALPDVVAIIAQPEQMMWLCMAASYFTGKKFEFKVSGYNAQCVETTLLPYTTGKINISLGCYGCRASSDIGDDMMFMGVPRTQMPQLINGVAELSKKAIPDSRAKIYLPPQV